VEDIDHLKELPVSEIAKNVTLFRYIPSKVVMQRIVYRAATLRATECFFTTENEVI